MLCLDEGKVFLHGTEMTEHVNASAQYLEALLSGSFITREQTRDMVGICLQEQKGISKVPFCFNKEKRMQRLRHRELLFNTLTSLMGLSYGHKMKEY